MSDEHRPDRLYGIMAEFDNSEQLIAAIKRARSEGYSRMEFDLTGSGERLAALIPENDAYRPADVPFNVAARGATDLEKITADRFEAKLGDAQLEFSGELQMKPTLAARGIRLKGSGPRLSDLGELGGLRFADKPFEASASMTGDARDQRIDDLDEVIGLIGRQR